MGAGSAIIISTSPGAAPWVLSRSAQVDRRVDGAELVLELQVTGTEIVLFTQVPRGRPPPRDRRWGILDLGSDGAAQTEDDTAFSAQNLDDLANGVFQAALGHVAWIEFLIHQIAVVTGHFADDDDVDQFVVQVGEEDAVGGGQLSASIISRTWRTRGLTWDLFSHQASRTRAMALPISGSPPVYSRVAGLPAPSNFWTR